MAEQCLITSIFGEFTLGRSLQDDGWIRFSKKGMVGLHVLEVSPDGQASRAVRGCHAFAEQVARACRTFIFHEVQGR